MLWTNALAYLSRASVTEDEKLYNFDTRTKKSVDLLQNLLDYYRAQYT